jgi:light-regulated signal transduction histidine kinase (bacteriophytochrome)
VKLKDSQTAHAAPAFGKADLSNCEREQIQFAGSIQPHGALLLVREADQVIVQASENAAAFLAIEGPLPGRRLADLPGDLAERIGARLEDSLHGIPVAVRCRVGPPLAEYDALLHRPDDVGLIIELERAGPPVDVSHRVDNGLQTILTCTSLRALCDESARLFKDLTGYDRVMVYRFDDDGHGEVFSERREARLEPYLGNRYPASDIPQIARRLYERNRVRVLVDVEAHQVPLAPRASPLSGKELDMSLCFLRSMSPIHIQYLKNMGVCATLVASLMVNDKLWGLVACHHYVPRFVHYEIRAVCELLAEAVATRIAALESFAQAQVELSVRRLEQHMIDAIGREGDWRAALFDGSRSLLQPLDAGGAALLFDGAVLTAGEVPGTQALRAIGEWLDARPRTPLIATSSLGLDEPEFAALTPVASGLLATPVSTSPGEYLLWFRPERIRTVTWGGNPFKAFTIGNDPTQLSPRRSFAQWHQVVEGTADPWTPAELATARLIGESVSDVVLQFRSVRMLIAQDQLAQATRQVQLSDQPVIIADASGAILVANNAFQEMLAARAPVPARLDDLAPLFARAPDVRRSLRELQRRRQPWRAEVGLAQGTTAKPLLVRGDPVLASADRALGFVLLFTDLTERKAAEAARRRFQEDIIDRHRVMSVPLDSKADLVYRNLLSSVVDNAQLAALEITDGVDPACMPDALDSVRNSVSRTARLLQLLLWHSAGTRPERDPGE